MPEVHIIKKNDVVPKEIGVHAGKLRGGQQKDWVVKYIAEMEQ